MLFVTGILAAYVFTCILFPRVVKNRPQFYASVGVVLGALLLGAIPGTFFMFISGMLTAVAFATLVLATGGLSLHELSGEFGNAFEVLRHGDAQAGRTPVVPLRGERPAPRADDADDHPTRYSLDEEDAPGWPTGAPGGQGGHAAPTAGETNVHGVAGGGPGGTTPAPTPGMPGPSPNAAPTKRDDAGPLPLV